MNEYIDWGTLDELAYELRMKIIKEIKSLTEEQAKELLFKFVQLPRKAG